MTKSLLESADGWNVLIFLRCVMMIVGTYYFAAIVQTVLHRVFGHENRIETVYETHAKGHHGEYPPHRLLTHEWIGSEQHVMWYYMLLFVAVAISVFMWAGLIYFLCHTAGLGFAIWWHIYLHKQYHIRGSRWEKFHWFRRKRELHFIHHREVHKNYAIVEYWIDDFLGTRKEP